jgi:hypothetical protein
MKSFATIFAVSLAVALCAAFPVVGQTVNHIAFPGTLHEISDISGFMTTGEDMGGMRVTAHFSADLVAVTETVNWNPGVAGSLSGSATGTGWQLTQSGDTFDSLWRLFGDGPNLTLFGLTIEGFMESDDPVSERATVFDRISPFFGTDGSYRGHDLDPFAFAGNWEHVRVSYIDEVDNLADPKPGPQKDVYRVLRLQFGRVVDAPPLPQFVPMPFTFNNELLFLQDTDTVGERIPNGDPGEEGVPEPTSLALFMLGVALCGLQLRDRGC